MGRILSKEEWLKRRKFKKLLMTVSALCLMFIILIMAALLIGKLLINFLGGPEQKKEAIEGTLSNGTVIRRQYLTPNEYSRPQTKLKKVKGIVIHYTANPGTTAKGNRSYFEGLATKHTTKASSHYIIGLEGEIIQCIPLTEIAYASNNRNDDTISIECCHPDETGEFTEETYQSLVSLSAALCREYNLKEEDILRHYDVTEKLCPLYYVEHEDAWLKLKEDIIEEAEASKED
jgi:N-acetylmuramoyl-L-alanine amidase CwlA